MSNFIIKDVYITNIDEKKSKVSITVVVDLSDKPVGLVAATREVFHLVVSAAEAKNWKDLIGMEYFR